jgi:hypothetical protein
MRVTRIGCKRLKIEILKSLRGLRSLKGLRGGK